MPQDIEIGEPASWYPLSSGQLSMWLLAQLGAPHAAYTVPGVYDIHGRLDPAALHSSLTRLLFRHESLRTAFSQVDGVPLQRPINDFAIDLVTETDVDGDSTESLIEAFLQQDFDFPAGRLVRFMVVQQSPDRHLFVVSAHHIAIDGWSLTVLMDEVIQGYNESIDGRLPEDPPNLQYKDYARWQQGLLEGHRAETASDYWSNKLKGSPAALDLPADRTRPSARSFRGAVSRHTTAITVLQDLKSMCRDERTTLFAGLSGVLRVLLFRYTGQRDVIFGTSAFGRPSESLYQQIGYYVNTLPLRDRIAEGATFRELLRAAHATLSESIRHGDYPFNQIVEQAGITTSINRNPLFDVMAMMDSGWGTPTVMAAGLEIRRVEPPVGFSKMDLTFHFAEKRDGLGITVEYSTELFDEIRIRRMLTHFETLLTNLVAHPELEVETVDLLAEAERSKLLADYNATDFLYDTDMQVHELFERQAAATPARIAVVDDERRLTFGELNAKANALAWKLRAEFGVAAGDIVALQLDRSVNLTVTILGVLKAGAGYLPLAKNDPPDRIAEILDDSSAQIVLIDGLGAIQDSSVGLSVVDVTEFLEDASRLDNLASTAGPNDIAYCIYTSGSTGVPNGVVVENRGLVNRLLWMIDELNLTSRDVVLQKTPYTFDVSVWEILLPGIIGARQVMLAADGQSDPRLISDTIVRQGVTMVHFVPTMLGHYILAGGSFVGVRSVVCSGEELNRSLATRFFGVSSSAHTQLYNFYGPTEATIDVSLSRVENKPATVTIGKPTANTRLYILDTNLKLCPVGVPGELYISGMQLARGYLNRRGKTSATYICDPFRTGIRMYRTGDIARWDEAGDVEYLGRRDRQVKLHGFRIELGEIEQALSIQNGVAGAVAAVRRDDSGTGSIWAYVEKDGPEASPTPSELQAALRLRLPHYMLPTYFVLLDSIPVTASGKLDLRRLDTLSDIAQVAQVRDGAPLNAIEHRLSQIWATLLPLDRVGTEDDFFLVGGSSLSALQLSSRIKEVFKVELSIAVLTTHRTVAAQAALVVDSVTAVTSPIVVEPIPRSDRHVLSFAQKRMWFLHLLDPDSGSYNIPVLIHISGSVDAGIMAQAVDSLSFRHEILRTTFSQDGGEVYQRVRDDLPVAFELRDLGTHRDDVVRQVRDVSASPFSLTDSPPLRVVLFRLSHDEWKLLVVVHHIAGDGWTMRLLMNELSTLYSGHTAGDTSPLPTPPVQYIDYAAALHRAEHLAVVENDLAYWTRHLHDSPPLDLPTDEAYAVTKGSSGRLATHIAPDVGRRLRELASRSSTTPFEIAMSALTVVLSRLSGQADVTIGFPVVSRPNLDIERAVGLFLDTLVLRVDLAGGLSFTQLLTQVSSRIREAYAHQTAPFELLVERLNPVRSLDRSPLFDVLLNYLGDLAEKFTIDGCDTQVDDSQFVPQAKFPLTFYVRDELDGGMLIELVYRTDLFSRTRAEAMISQYADVLRRASIDTDWDISRYELRAGAARKQHAMLASALDAPPHLPVTELISQVAAQHPYRVAIQFGQKVVTYHELVSRSEAVARSLVAGKCSVGGVVGVTGLRGIGFVVALLGVLRSGAIAFPLDSSLPEGRKNHLLKIGNVTTFVCVTPEHGRRDFVQEGVAVEVDDDGMVLFSEEQSFHTSLPVVSSANPAYLFFTSGTTGVPRGVVGRHAGLSHFLTWQAREFALGEHDRCSQLTSHSFDVMLRDTFLALIAGGTLVIPEKGDEQGGKAIFRWLKRTGITVLHAAPTVLQSWIMDADVRPGSLRLTICSGEPIKSILVENIRKTCPAAEVVAFYGTTETTLAKFFYRIPDGEPLPSVIPVGKPLPQTQGFVMRADGVLCGVGETGEIVIRTPFRTLGYLNDPAATRARFFENPLRTDGDDLLHRTGDTGRMRPDGLIEVLGREDHQVKISGVRIQPPEIENAIALHPLVSTSIVVARKDMNGDPQLIAYVVPKGLEIDELEFAEQLRQHLMGLLAGPMVPGRYVFLDQIPTNSNGKPDRARLPEPDIGRLLDRSSSNGPSSDVEREIYDVWSTVLDEANPGVDDNFFILGGTSLKLMRLHALLNERFPNTFRVAQLFTHRTISMQAALVSPTPNRPEAEVTEHEF